MPPERCHSPHRVDQFFSAVEELRTNTSKKRQMSLYNQGSYWYMAIPNMREERLSLLMQAYVEVLREHEFLQDICGII